MNLIRINKSNHPKLIYFAEKNQKFDYLDFKEKWRDHAKLGMSMPRWKNIYKYSHCDPIFLNKRFMNCDGVGIVWYRSEVSRRKHLADNVSRSFLKEDEKLTFARPVKEFSMLADEYIFNSIKLKKYKLFIKVWKSQRLNYKDFKTKWLNDSSAQIIENLNYKANQIGYIQNHFTSHDKTELNQTLCDCIDEIDCNSYKDIINKLKRKYTVYLENNMIKKFELLCSKETILYNLN